MNLCSEWMRVCVCVCVLMRAQLCLTVCDFMDCNPPGSSVHGISQARTLEWVAISRESSQTRDQTKSLGSPTWAGKFFAPGTTWVCSVTPLIGQKLMWQYTHFPSIRPYVGRPHQIFPSSCNGSLCSGIRSPALPITNFSELSLCGQRWNLRANWEWGELFSLITQSRKWFQVEKMMAKITQNAAWIRLCFWPCE